MSDSIPSQNGAPAGKAAPSGELRNAVLAFRQHMHSLRISLIQGDLQVARFSFAALQGILPAAPAEVSMSPRVVSTGASAYVSLYRALEKGDLPEARKAFLGLLSSLRTPPPARPRHRRSGLESGKVLFSGDGGGIPLSRLWLGRTF